MTCTSHTDRPTKIGRPLTSQFSSENFPFAALFFFFSCQAFSPLIDRNLTSYQGQVQFQNQNRRQDPEVAPAKIISEAKDFSSG